MRVVLDTNVLVRSANGFPSPAFEIFRRCSASPHVLLVSAFLVAEVSRAMRYPRVRALHGLSEDGMATFLDDLLMTAQVVEVPAAMTEDGICKDVDDNAVIALAVAGDADVLCTLDRHLKTEAVISYLGSMGIEVMSDIELLRRVRS